MRRQEDIEDLFDPVQTYPNPDAAERLACLVGLDEHKERLHKMLTLLVVPSVLQDWAAKFHSSASTVINTVLAKPPLVILTGDVGCGKTALAESISDSIAREQEIDVTLFPMSLTARGKGAVGEMTQLLSKAFEHAHSTAKKIDRDKKGRTRGAIVLLIDEADALAQSREAAQMHHEDRAGVNALIRGIDRLANSRLPAAVIMCTNRLEALDPAVQRRAADILEFHRPDDKQREAVLRKPLSELGIKAPDIEKIVRATGAQEEDGNLNSVGFTFSDLIQRLLPTIVLDAFPSSPVEASKALKVAQEMRPTRPFGSL